MATPEQQAQSMLDNVEAKTGKTLAQWHAILAKAKLAKHGEMMKLLKGEHAVTHGFANLIVHEYRNRGAQSEDPVAAQYAGPKAKLKPTYDAVIKMVEKFGQDVEVSPKKTYVSLRRSKQFALVQPSTQTRLDIGLNLKGVEPTERLEASGSFSAMCSHRVRITDKKQVNAELKAWLKRAYENA